MYFITFLKNIIQEMLLDQIRVANTDIGLVVSIFQIFYLVYFCMVIQIVWLYKLRQPTHDLGLVFRNTSNLVFSNWQLNYYLGISRI